MPNPITLAFQLLNLKEAVGGFTQIANTIKDAEGNARSLVEILHGTGGDAGEAGALQGIARLAGHDPRAAGGAARGLRERLAGSPLAQSAFGQGVLPSQTGQLVNEARLYREVVRQILDARTAEEAKMKAQIADMEDLLPLRDADRRLTRDAIQLGEERGSLLDEELRKERANLQVLRQLRQSRSAITRERLALALEKQLIPAMQAAEIATLTWKEALDSLVSGKLQGTILPGLVKGAAEAFTDPAQGSRGFHPRMGGVIPRGQAAIDKNTQAMTDLTEELIALKKEYLNDRGHRAGGAVPRYLRGKALEKALEDRAFDLGAVTF
jgi:hypothetical protein